MRKAKKSSLFAKLAYPAGVVAAFFYLWNAGEWQFAIIASGIGAAGTAYGWACE